MSDNEFDNHEDNAPIEYLEIGERKEMLGGPATEAGWYLHPRCMIGCCKSDGPFSSEEAALEVDRIIWERIARNSQSRSETEHGRNTIKPF